MNSTRRKMRVGEKKTSTAKIALIYTISNIITRGMAFLTTPIFSRLMSKEEYGQFSNIASWANILTVIATADLYASISRAKYDFDGEIDKFMSSIMVLSNIFTLCLYWIVENNMFFFEKFFSMKAIYIRFIFIYMMFWPASQFLQKKSQIYSKYKSVVAISCASLLLSTTASVVLILVLENKLLARVIGNYFVVIILYAILWGYILFKGRSCSKKHCLYALKISVPLILHNLAGNLLNSSDRIIINKLCGAEEAALYSLAYTIAMIASLILNSLNQAYLPWLYDKLHENNLQEVGKNSVVYIGTFFAFAAAVILVAPEIVLIFGGEKYFEACFIIAPIIIGISLQFIYTLYVNIEFYTKKTFLISCGTMGAAFINIFLNYICIPKWGFIAAAYTTIVGYFLLVFFHYLVVAWKCKEYVDIYSRKIIVFFVIVLSCVSGICLFLYPHTFIRYVVILLFMIITGIIAYTKRTMIKQMFMR